MWYFPQHNTSKPVRPPCSAYLKTTPIAEQDKMRTQDLVWPRLGERNEIFVPSPGHFATQPDERKPMPHAIHDLPVKSGQNHFQKVLYSCSDFGFL